MTKKIALVFMLFCVFSGSAAMHGLQRSSSRIDQTPLVTNTEGHQPLLGPTQIPFGIAFLVLIVLGLVFGSRAEKFGKNRSVTNESKKVEDWLADIDEARQTIDVHQQEIAERIAFIRTSIPEQKLFDLPTDHRDLNNRIRAFNDHYEVLMKIRFAHEHPEHAGKSTFQIARSLKYGEHQDSRFPEQNDLHYLLDNPLSNIDAKGMYQQACQIIRNQRRTLANATAMIDAKNNCPIVDAQIHALLEGLGEPFLNEEQKAQHATGIARHSEANRIIAFAHRYAGHTQLIDWIVVNDHLTAAKKQLDLAAAHKVPQEAPSTGMFAWLRRFKLEHRKPAASS